MLILLAYYMQVLQWIDLPKEKRPSFMTLYMHEPDRQGHKFGPYSPQVCKISKKLFETITIFLFFLLVLIQSVSC